MHSEEQVSLRKRISAIYVIIAVTGVLALAAIFQIDRGLTFHASNLQHLGLSSTLKQDVRAMGDLNPQTLDRLRELLGSIKVEPEACLSSNALVYGALSAQGLTATCEADLAHIQKAFDYIDQYEQGDISKNELMIELDKISGQLQRYSFDLHPPVSRTIDIMLVLLGLLFCIKAGAAIMAAKASVRAASQHVDDFTRIENQLQTKSKQLELTIRDHKRQEEHRKLKAEQERVDNQTMLDAMTNLPNQKSLDKKLAQWAEERCKIALFMIDIDQVRNFNDNYGHTFGDSLIISIANRLQQIIGKDDFIARFNGDKFVVISPIISIQEDQARLDIMAQDMVASASQPLTLQGIKAQPTISVGIVVQTHDAEFDGNFDLLGQKADMALKSVKTDGRNNYAFFDAALHETLEFERTLRKEIQDGIFRGEFVAHYHPQYDAQTLDLVGVEALIRWYHPTRGCLTPYHFLDAARQIGLMASIDKLVFKQALADLANWKEQGIVVPRLSVNVSPERLMDEDLLTSLQASNFVPGEIAFEIAERILDEKNDQEMIRICQDIKALGIELEIDDFGSGQGSIFHLSTLKPKRLKIDHQLIMRERLDDAEFDRLDSIVTIANAIGIEIIAESVDDDEGAQSLKDMGCQILQGYYFNEPISAEDFLEHMLNEKPKPNLSASLNV